MESLPYPGDGLVVESAARELVHITYHVPNALVGLLIGVRGASIHAVEHVSGCHLSLDRSTLHTDGPVPYLVLHVHGSAAGAATAVAMCDAILHRHVEGIEATYDPAAALSPQVPIPVPVALPQTLNPSPMAAPSTPVEQPMMNSLALRSRWMQRDMAGGGSSDAGGQSDGEQ